MSLIKNGNLIGGISKALLRKIGFSDLNTESDNICDAINELESDKVSKSGDTMTGDLSWNGVTGYESGLYWKEHGYGDQFKIYPHFTGSNDNNYLTIATAVGDADTQPSLTEKFKFYPSGKLEMSSTLAINDGNMQLKSTYADITKSDNNVSSNLNRYFRFYDKNNLYSGYFGNDIYQNGRVGVTLAARNYTSATNYVDNRIVLGVTKDGTRSVNVSDASIWRTALGLGSMATQDTGSYVPMSGRAIKTGTLTLKATNISTIQAGGSYDWSNAEYEFLDMFGDRAMTLNWRKLSTSKMGVYLQAQRGSTYNHIALFLDGTTISYAVSNATAFRTAIGAAASSSKLTKTNIEDMDEAEAEKIMNIDVKSFQYKDGFVNECDKRDIYYGVIAEDVIDIIPYAVNKPNDYDEKDFVLEKGLQQNLLTVDYVNFVPYLIKKVQLQQKQIDKLIKEVSHETTRQSL